MAISRIKQIKRILKEHDVRDPRGALQAIEQVVAQPKTEQPTEGNKPLLKLVLVKTGDKKINVAVKFDSQNLTPRHLVKVIDSLHEFGNDVFGGECNDPNCPVHGTGAEPADLGELFKKLEETAIAEAKKGKLQ